MNPQKRSLDGELLDSARLSLVLKALASQVRIDLMKALQVPRTLGEIHVQPRRGGSASVLMSRAVLRRHLEQLLAIGVVRSVHLPRNGRRTIHYVVNHSQTFVLTEELRRLALLRLDGAVADGTLPGPPPPKAQVTGPRLTLVNGLYEGRNYALPRSPSAAMIGRGPSCAIRLDYDPFVSLQHARVEEARGQWWLLDLPTSRNGTDLNWEAVALGVAHPLTTGDVVRVGRSSLLFRAG
jgi:hypothetical protein